MIKGIHHVSMRCSGEEKCAEVIRFYHELLGLPIVHRWGNGLMFGTGAGFVEIITNQGGNSAAGAIPHFALATEDVDKYIRIVEAEGYEIITPPKDVVIPSDPPLPARIAFCRGPLGEEVEFFWQK